MSYFDELARLIRETSPGTAETTITAIRQQFGAL